MKWLLSELQRRQVTRVIASYIVASWILLQVATSLENALSLPPWFDTSVLMLLVLGFPVAVVLSWMFDLTPEGIRRTIGFGDGIPAPPRPADWMLITMLAVVGVAAAVIFMMPRSSDPATLGKSIAILPFENRSQSKDDSEYGDWLSELISSLLGKANGLRVISQTSSSVFKGKAVALPEMARQLGVSMVVEGSVRSEGDDIVISAQLIDAVSDTQVWRSIYQRKTANALGVQTEVASMVAAAIAEKLNIRLSTEEQKALNPTSTPAAYEAYREALKLYRTSANANMRAAQRLLNDAVDRDPEFATAWALLSRVHSWLYFNGSDATEGRRAAAEKALTQALALKPELADVMLADAYYQYWVERDYDGARQRFEALSGKWPSNADVLSALASITRRLGRWDESKAYFQRAVAHDPLHASRRLKSAELLLAMRDFDGALKELDASLELWPTAPDNIPFLARKALVLLASGRINDAQALLKDMKPQPDGELVSPITVRAILARDYGNTITLLQELLKQDEAEGSVGRTSIDLNLDLGDLRRLSGDKAGARKNYHDAISELRAELDRQPDSADIQSYLALAYSGLGERAEATKFAALAVKNVPVSKDAFSGAYYLDVQARVLSRVGDKADAIETITTLMKSPAPFPLTPSLLRLDPDFDRLRGEARFKALLVEQH
jgi:TolB-like protein/predicted Zn-dependent protease